MATYTVETREQGALILGGEPSLVQALTRELQASQVLAQPLSSLADFVKFSATHDADYLIIFDDLVAQSILVHGDRELPALLAKLVATGESRLFLITREHAEGRGVSLAPITRRIRLCDYISQDGLSAPYLAKILSDLSRTKTLKLPGDGLQNYSLLDEDDAVKLIAKSIIKPVLKAEESIILGNPSPISLLNLAYIIRTNLPFKVELEFNGAELPLPATYDQDAYLESLAKLKYQLLGNPMDTLSKYLSSHPPFPAPTTPVPVRAPKPELRRPAPTQSDPPKTTLPPLKKLTPLKTPQPVFVPLQTKKFSLDFLVPAKTRFKKPRLPRLPLIVGRGLMIAFALYLGSLAFTLTLTAMSVQQISRTLNPGSLSQPNPLNLGASTYLLANAHAISSLPGLSNHQGTKDLVGLLDSYQQTLLVLGVAGELSQTIQGLSNYIFGTSDADIAQLVSLARLQSEDLYQKLSLLEGSLPPDPPSIIPDKYGDRYQDSRLQLQRFKRSLTTTKALLATTPDLIGIGAKRKYAVLFQNNMELRATGGFIGSFAILNFENGKLYDMPIYDVYDADGQLKGHVEPPAPIKEILNEPAWYLRDSNFDPDFPTSARRAEWFIKKSLNQDLDGTIAVTVNTLSALLSATGPIEVSDYNETISANNLYERAQYHAEVNFFPGSTQKKEFLSTVANSLFAILPTLDESQGLKLISALSETVQEKNTLISVLNPATDYVFETLNWNGQISDLPCPSQDNCHKDFAMVVDSNFGVNKANYFINRHIEQVITFDKNLAVNHVLKLNYQNTSTSTAWPAGNYKNYQRIYLPLGANITSVKIGDTALSPDQYELSTQHNKFVVAYLVSVPINSTVLVELEYTTPQLSQGNDLLYTWYWQKQPGTSSKDNLVVYLNYPMYLRPTVISPQSDLSPQQLKFNLQNDTDRRLTVRFSR